MAKFEGYVKTNRVGSEVTFEFEIEDSDLEDMSEVEINDIASQEMLGRDVFEWGFKEK